MRKKWEICKKKEEKGYQKTKEYAKHLGGGEREREIINSYNIK